MTQAGTETLVESELVPSANVLSELVVADSSFVVVSGRVV